MNPANELADLHATLSAHTNCATDGRNWRALWQRLCEQRQEAIRNAFDDGMRKGEEKMNTTINIPSLHIQLRSYLDTLTINSNNIGAIRARLLMPFSCDWNGLVRDETASREQCAPEWHVADDDHHAMMNGPRIAQSLGLNQSDTPRTDAATIACGWDTTQPVVPKTFAQDIERECAYRERNRREVQKEWERCHDSWRNAQVRIEAMRIALSETDRLLACEPQAWTQAKTDQMRRNQALIHGMPPNEGETAVPSGSSETSEGEVPTAAPDCAKEAAPGNRAGSGGADAREALRRLLVFHPESPETGAELPPECWASEYRAAVEYAHEVLK